MAKSPNIKTVEFRLTPKQTQAYDHLTDNEDCSVLYGGAKGGGKSFLLTLWAFDWVNWLIDFFDLENCSLKYPLTLGFIGRKQSVDFTDTTFETFKKIIPSECYVIRQQEKEIIVRGLGKILFGGLDDTEVVNKFNSAEFAFIGIDQAEETQRADVSILQATLRFVYNGKRPPYKQCYTANPSECWLKDDFIIASKKNHYFIPALPDDNPYLPQTYKDNLREVFSYDLPLLKAYLEGDWDAFSGVGGYLIPSKYVNAARLIELEDDEEVKIISSDVATKHGECKTVILYRQGHTMRSIKILSKIPTTMIAQEIRREYEKQEADNIIIDSDGFGEGVADVLTSQKIGVTEFHGGYAHKAIDEMRFKNLRSQFYWVVAKKFEKGQYSLKDIPQNIFEELRRQLCSIKVKPPDPLNRIQVETKEDMLARGLPSPDLADSLMMSEYGYWMGRMADVKAYAYR